LPVLQQFQERENFRGVAKIMAGTPGKTEKPWMRLYTEVVNDPKVQMLPPDIFKFWINFLCLARQGGGFVYAENIPEHCWTLRMDEKEFDRCAEFLIARNLIDIVADGMMSPHGWEKRQYESDSSTDRSRAFRERQRQQQGNVPPADISTVDSQSLQRSGNGESNADATLQQRPQIQNTDTETDTDSLSVGGLAENDTLPADAGGGEGENSLFPAETTTPTKTPPKPKVDPDAKPKELFAAFREGRFPNKTQAFWDDIPGSEYRQNKSSLVAMVKDGITPDLMLRATRTAMSKYRDPSSMVTLPAICRNFSSLTEDEPPLPRGNGLPVDPRRPLREPLKPQEERIAEINASINRIAREGDMFSRPIASQGGTHR
jgi:hypothetical protein